MIFLVIFYVTWFSFSKKIACGHPFHYQLIKMLWSLHTDRQGLPQKYFNLIFVDFMLLFVILFMYLPCSGGLQHKTYSYKFCKIHRKQLSARLYFSLSCRDSACKFIKKESPTQMFSSESYKVLAFFCTQVFTDLFWSTASVFFIFFLHFG